MIAACPLCNFACIMRGHFLCCKCAITLWVSNNSDWISLSAIKYFIISLIDLVRKEFSNQVSLHEGAVRITFFLSEKGVNYEKTKNRVLYSRHQHDKSSWHQYDQPNLYCRPLFKNIVTLNAMNLILTLCRK